jgi:hypothetical protein
VLESEYSREVYRLFWTVLMDPTNTGHIISLSFGSSNNETRYVET